MNAVFLKQVPDTVLNAKLICSKHTQIGPEDYILEISIADKFVKNVIKNTERISWINNIKVKFIMNKFKKKISNLINKNSLLGYSVIYSNEIKMKTKLKEYIDSLLKEYSILEYVNLSTIEKNMNKYIEEYTEKNGIKQENINVLIMLENIENLNINLIEKLNEKYKVVNIYTILKPTKKILNKIKKINDEYGSCISVLRKTEKDFRKYNICIFVDNPRTEYTKYRFNKKACFIDFTNKENDRFNEKYIKLEEAVKNNIYYEDKIKELYGLYGKVTVSNAIID